MKTQLSVGVARLAQVGDKFLGMSSTPTIPSRKFVQLVSPASAGSLGDEAMIMATLAYLDLDRNAIEILEPRHISEKSPVYGARVRHLDERNHSGGYLPERDLTHGRSHTLVFGADMFDGAYGIRSVSQRLALMNQSVRNGGKAALVNFSLRKSRHAHMDALLRNLDTRVSVWARDPYSADRASAIFRRNVGSSPDVAAYLPALNSKTSPDTELPGVKIALVVNGHLANSHLAGEEGTLKYFTRLALALSSRCDYLFVCAHDLRSSPNDPELARRVVQNVGRNAKGYVPQTAAEAKGFLANVDLCVTARMHAAVASLSEGVPTVGLDYVDKFRGQFIWYGQEEAVLKVDASQLETVIDRVQESLNRLGELRSSISEQAMKVRTTPVPWLDL